MARMANAAWTAAPGRRAAPGVATKGKGAVSDYPELLDRSGAGEWLTIRELGSKLGYAPRTVRKKMHDGTWSQGVHWFKRAGCRPLFCWPAVVAWLRATDALPPHGAAFDPDLPPARPVR